jgi:hypothetical protein
MVKDSKDSCVIESEDLWGFFCGESTTQATRVLPGIRNQGSQNNHVVMKFGILAKRRQTRFGGVHMRRRPRDASDAGRGYCNLPPTGSHTGGVAHTTNQWMSMLKEAFGNH